jgi:cell wall-associated NlpC family hydrolase
MSDNWRSLVVEAARAQIGKPYRYGGTGPDDWDCCALVQHCFSAAGIALPRLIWQQKRSASRLSTGDALLPADLIISDSLSHIQIVVGDGTVIEASLKHGICGVFPLDLEASKPYRVTNPAGEHS